MIRNLSTCSKYAAARIDQMMFDGAELRRALGQRLRRRGIDAAGIDGHGDDRPLIGVLEPGHAERGVEAAGKSQENGLGALAVKSMSWVLASEEGEQAHRRACAARARRRWR